ncbi:hypothetical protein PGB90_006747 [Kerria lacca]
MLIPIFPKKSLKNLFSDSSNDSSSFSFNDKSPVELSVASKNGRIHLVTIRVLFCEFCGTADSAK